MVILDQGTRGKRDTSTIISHVMKTQKTILFSVICNYIEY
jgi:hypothetical protein